MAQSTLTAKAARIGGRQMGTPNRPTTSADIADYVKSIFTIRRRRQFARELDELQPADRCKVLATLLNGVSISNIEIEP